MEMEVVVPVAPVDFNFDSACSSPYMTAPSSPQRFGNFFFSAPTSPSRVSAFYRELNNHHHNHVSLVATNSSSSSSAIPFDWEEKPGTPKTRNTRQNNNGNGFFDDDHEDSRDFEFDFSGHLGRTSLSADELFDGGKIKPLKPPPGYDSSVSSVLSSPRTNTQRKDFDPFQAAVEKTRRRETKQQQQHQQHVVPHQRGRERGFGSSTSSSSSSTRKGSRSLSPLRVSDIMSEQEEHTKNAKTTITSTTESSSSSTSFAASILSAISFSTKGYKKWKLKDLLLFRSASEGRATSISKDPIAKYVVFSKKEAVEDVKNASFRSTDSSVGSSSRRRGPVSAHEIHYTVNRAVAEEMKRKTFLPYKQGLLGCLGFNPGNGMHEISRGFGSLTRV